MWLRRASKWSRISGKNRCCPPKASKLIRKGSTELANGKLLILYREEREKKKPGLSIKAKLYYS